MTSPVATSTLVPATSAEQLTPPPSSPQLSQPLRDTSPNSNSTTSHLSSPPPIVGASANVAGNDGKGAGLALDDPVGRDFVDQLNDENVHLKSQVQHWRLQHKMLAIESAEMLERVLVENNLDSRERDVLQATDQQHDTAEHQPAAAQSMADPTVREIHIDLYNAMMKEIQDLKTRNIRHESTIAHQKTIIVQQENEIASMNDRITLLRERLQENRDHLNRYRRPDHTPKSERSTQYQVTPNRGAIHRPPQRPFAALLHATHLMNHDASPSAPTTPKRKRDYAPAMPVTPKTAQPALSRNIYETPQSSRTFHPRVPMSAPAPRMAPLTTRAPETALPQRDNDSDGTVSAPDDSEAETEVPDEHVGESQASLLAGQLLLTPTRPAAQRSVRGNTSLTQSRLFGQVKKSIVQDDHDQRQTKKARTEDPVGLGIAGFRER